MKLFKFVQKEILLQYFWERLRDRFQNRNLAAQLLLVSCIQE